MTGPTVSVVIVSYDRPDDLELCLKALALQYYRNFEIVVVHNSTSREGLLASGLASEIKSASCDFPNISAARNIGINLASGDIAAFIDDDAIAEPTWIQRLIEPFSDPEIAAAGGFVIARNGFDVQWGGEVVNDLGEATERDIVETTTIRPKPNEYAKTHGTNCAFRREILQEFGGFDENYRFFLDETDLNVRLGKAGKCVALVPEAEVHHRFSKSRYRKQSRAPRSLFEIGASTAYFLNKHAPNTQHLAAVRTAQERRIRSYVLSGHLEPRDIAQLMETFEEGVLDGEKRTVPTSEIRSTKANVFLAFRPYSGPKEAIFISCRRLMSNSARKQAEHAASNNCAVTLFVFSWTNIRHHRRFHQNGYWLQSGGLFGKSKRSQRPFKVYTLASRTRAEIDDLSEKRGIAKQVKNNTNS